MRLGQRAVVFGAMGRMSLEADLRTRYLIEAVDEIIAKNVDRGDDDTIFLEDWFEELEQLGVGARLAIPRLIELGNHRNPWVRLWATQTLEKIRPSRS